MRDQIRQMNGQDTTDSEFLMSLDGRKQQPVRAATGRQREEPRLQIVGFSENFN
jgi:hypothetical protein